MLHDITVMNCLACLEVIIDSVQSPVEAWRLLQELAFRRNQNATNPWRNIVKEGGVVENDTKGEKYGEEDACDVDDEYALQ